MIEIKCSKAQYNRIIEKLMFGGTVNGKCVLGKNEFTCPAVNGLKPELTCTECFKKKFKRVED